MLACGEDLGLIPSCVHPVWFMTFSLRKLAFTRTNDFIMFEMLIYCITTLMQVMQELGLIGLRIQRMPSEADLEFGIPSQYSYMTVNSIYFNWRVSVLHGVLVVVGQKCTCSCYAFLS